MIFDTSEDEKNISYIATTCRRRVVEVYTFFTSLMLMFFSENFTSCQSCSNLYFDIPTFCITNTRKQQKSPILTRRQQMQRLGTRIYLGTVSSIISTVSNRMKNQLDEKFMRNSLSNFLSSSIFLFFFLKIHVIRLIPE